MATIPSFRTWVAGEIVTAAYMNTNIRDAGNFFLSWPVCETRQGAAQSLPNNTLTNILFDTNDIDTDGGHSTSVNTDRYVGKTAGRFQVSGGVGYAAGVGTWRVAEIQKNGAAINIGSHIAIPNSGTTHRMPTRTLTLSLNGTTDYVTIVAFQNSGGALNTATTTGDQSHMSVRMVGTT